MTDGTGSVSYAYDQLSRLTSETRTINGVGTYPLNYAYNLAGELTSITDPFSAQVGYNYDTTGRTTAVTGSGFGNVSTYASNLQYRAWGGLKYMDYGNTRSLSQTYNSRLQPATFSIPNVMSKTYDYQADGRLSFSHDLINSQWDRSYAYDHAGRITQALSGGEARNEGTTNVRPYKQTFVYDAFGHLTERPWNLWWSGSAGAFTPSHQDYQNNRNVTWQYDADGNLTDTGSTQFSDYVQYTVDAAGQNSRSVSVTMNVYSDPNSTVWGSSVELINGFDGDGQTVKKVANDTTIDYTEGNTTATTNSYTIRSTVLNQVLTELSETGQKQRTFVYLGSAVLALQQKSGSTDTVSWEHRDASNASVRLTLSNGGVTSSGAAELDPLGNDTGTTNPFPNPALKQFWSYPGFGSSMMSGMTCVLDGTPAPCDEVGWLMRTGGAGLCPFNNCGPQFDPKRDGPGRGGWVLPVLHHDGFSYESVGPSTRPRGLLPPKLVPFDPNRPFDPDIEQPIHGPQNPAGQRCDDRLAGMFGGEGSVFATDRDPSTLANPGARDRNRLLSPSESPVNGHAHIYASPTGAGVAGGNLFTPSGYKREERAPYTAHQDTIPELQNYHRFTYLPGSLQRFGYSGGLVISFIHSGPTNSAGRPFPATASGTPGSVLVGTIGNFGGVDVGGSDPGYVHSHIRFYAANRRGKIGAPIDPRSVFVVALGSDG